MDAGSAMYLLMAGGVLMAVIGMTLLRLGSDDPLRSAAYVCFFIGGVDLLLAGLAITVGMAVAVEKGLPTLIVAIVSAILGAEGVVFLGLGFGIARESKVCALIAATLYTALSVLTVGRAGSGALCAVMLRITFSIILWRAYFNAVQLAQLDRIADARRAQLDAEKRQRGGGVAVSAALPPPRPLVGTGRLDRPPSGRFEPPVADEPPTGTLIVKKSAASAKPALSVCPNCRRAYTTGRARCLLCNVHLYEEA